MKKYTRKKNIIYYYDRFLRQKNNIATYLELLPNNMSEHDKSYFGISVLFKNVSELPHSAYLYDYAPSNININAQEIIAQIRTRLTKNEEILTKALKCYLPEFITKGTTGITNNRLDLLADLILLSFLDEKRKGKLHPTHLKKEEELILKQYEYSLLGIIYVNKKELRLKQQLGRFPRAERTKANINQRRFMIKKEELHRKRIIKEAEIMFFTLFNKLYHQYIYNPSFYETNKIENYMTRHKNTIKECKKIYYKSKREKHTYEYR